MQTDCFYSLGFVAEPASVARRLGNWIVKHWLHTWRYNAIGLLRVKDYFKESAGSGMGWLLQSLSLGSGTSSPSESNRNPRLVEAMR